MIAFVPALLLPFETRHHAPTAAIHSHSRHLIAFRRGDSRSRNFLNTTKVAWLATKTVCLQPRKTTTSSSASSPRSEDAASSSNVEKAGRKVRLVAIDMDGTLFNKQSVVSKENKDALRAAMDAGVHVVLATGKTRGSAEGLIAELGIKSPGVFLQGLAIYCPEGTVQHEVLLDDEVARSVVRMTEDDHTLVAYSHSTILTRQTNKLTDILAECKEPAPVNVHDAGIVPEAGIPEEGVSLMHAIGAVPIHKMLVLDEPKRVSKLRNRLSDHLGDSATLVQAMDNMLEILPPGSSKGNGLGRVLEALEIDWDDVVAIGDAENDIEMLQRAGTGVAMGNAKDSIKAIADVVVSPNCQHGVAEAIHKYVLPYASKE